MSMRHPPIRRQGLGLPTLTFGNGMKNVAAKSF
jgi:hypothetical protein